MKAATEEENLQNKAMHIYLFGKCERFEPGNVYESRLGGPNPGKSQSMCCYARWHLSSFGKGISRFSALCKKRLRSLAVQWSIRC
ncbi:unnamed protein product [Linum trigynum]|uniref:Uncharacterized protein n=1 Tax=Linum trigynum TaxID=586398 RepID=A0AAV2C8G3_9ROSI